MPTEWEKLMQLRFPDAKGQVKRAVETWNKRIRDKLRNETGFRMIHGDQGVSVQIAVSDGLPEELSEILPSELARWASLIVHRAD